MVYLGEFWATTLRQRPYHVENTSSRPITEVKQRWAWLVLGWVTNLGTPGNCFFTLSQLICVSKLVYWMHQITIWSFWSQAMLGLVSTWMGDQFLKVDSFITLSQLDRVPYHWCIGCTKSQFDLFEVKQCWAWLVLGWVTNLGTPGNCFFTLSQLICVSKLVYWMHQITIWSFWSQAMLGLVQ